jgi:hypothetical protein
MAYPSDTDYGVAVYRGAEAYSGMYVQSATFSQGYNNTDYAKDHQGTTKAMHQGDAKVDVSFEALVFEGTTPPKAGDEITYTSFLTGSLTNIIVTKADLRTENTGYARYSVTGESIAGIP